MSSLYQLFKPTLGCLFTHQSQWKEVYIQTYEGQTIPSMFCEYCKSYFKYPTKKDDYPVYRK